MHLTTQHHTTPYIAPHLTTPHPTPCTPNAPSTAPCQPHPHLQSHQAGEVLSLVTNQHDVAQEGNVGFDGILNWNRRDVLTTRSDDQLCWGQEAGGNSLTAPLTTTPTPL